MPHRTLKHTEEAIFDIELKLLLEAVYLKYQHDFRHYSVSSLRRRLTQALRRVWASRRCRSCRSASCATATLFSRLFQYLTVQVSEMFRDPAYFRALREQVLPILQTYPSIKVWVAGCSTGEEFWSLAILFAEEGLPSVRCSTPPISTPDALRQAETGIYPLDRHGGFQPELSGRGRQTLALRLLPCGLWRGEVFAGPQVAGRVRRSQPRHRRSVPRSTSRIVPQRADLFRPRACRTGRWVCSAIRWCAVDFSGWAARKVCGFQNTRGSFTDFDARERLYQKV